MAQLNCCHRQCDYLDCLKMGENCRYCRNTLPEQFHCATENRPSKQLFNWGLSDTAEVTLLTVSENATVIIRDPAHTATVILRMHRLSFHTVDEISSELEWTEALRAAAAGETTATIPTETEDHIATFDDGIKTRHRFAFALTKGTQPKAVADMVPGFANLGQISTRLHAHTEKWQVPSGFTRKT
ncbi:MAG: hypothetical protein R8G34_02975 [Paracoccaceae bacterium]|nr:hypothetical protein [Paracoccaceae bacterium]